MLLKRLSNVDIPARRRMTWSSSGSSEKWGILLAHSTRVKSCLSAAWQMFVTGSLGCREIHESRKKKWRLETDVRREIKNVSYLCFVHRESLLAESLLSSWATYHHMHIHASVHTALWIISSEEELVGRQNKQWFCPSLWKKYLQRAACEQTTFTRRFFYFPLGNF